ncbi:MAG: hypothetical protein LBQ15_06130 [Clostridium sp.]|jgi:hypothetical protein|nr:hypothetical protein [Clostridium sp.]
MKETFKKILKKNQAVYRFLCRVYAAKVSWTNYGRSSIWRMKRLKGRHQGERCFIVGNGPSLRAADLDRIAGEVTFGLNRIYRIFPETVWRPTYYVVSDSDLVRDLYAAPNETQGARARFFPSNFRGEYQGRDPAGRSPRRSLSTGGRAVLYRLKDCDPSGSPPPRFSADPSLYVTQGYTVTYVALQLACYMGFREIYLIGMDYSVSIYKDCKGNLYRDGQIFNHFYSQEADTLDTDTVPNLEICGLAYREARKYAEAHGIGIRNATRGGKLEVFERVDFDRIEGLRERAAEKES